MPVKSITTAAAVIDALGGTVATSRITGRKPAAVSNWRARGRLPAATLRTMQSALAERGLHAPEALWGIDEPGQAA
jgi:hypothetical protein